MIEPEKIIWIGSPPSDDGKAPFEGHSFGPVWRPGRSIGIEAICALGVDVAMIGEKRPKLSRRKARKLAYRYKGSNRGKRYRAFLEGATDGFWIDGRRLVRAPKFALGKITTLHSEDAAEIVNRLNATR